MRFKDWVMKSAKATEYMKESVCSLDKAKAEQDEMIRSDNIDEQLFDELEGIQCAEYQCIDAFYRSYVSECDGSTERFDDALQGIRELL